MSPRRLALCLFAGNVASCLVRAQTPSAPPMPRDYRGVQTHVDGLFVTPVANAPFTADVQIVSHTPLPDGTEHVVTTTNHVARSSNGRIYNERRRLMSPAFTGEPRLLSFHVYDPNTRQSTFVYPDARLARQSILPRPAAVPAEWKPPKQQPKLPGVVETSLGTQSLDGVELTGVRKERTVAPEMSGTGKPLVITDDYWYSPELMIYMIVRHNDPRTGEQLVAVTKVDRHEPPADRFGFPSDFKVVDETLPPRRERGDLADRPVEKNDPFPQ